MLGYILSFLFGRAYKGSIHPVDLLGELGNNSNKEKEREYIWSNVQNGEFFMYNLRSNDSWDGEEWVFVRLPDDDDELEPDEISWDDFVVLEPSYRPLGIWYKAHYRSGNKKNQKYWVQVTNPEPGKYRVFAADYLHDEAITCCPVKGIDTLAAIIEIMAAQYTDQGEIEKITEIME